ncbi:hypothetical protein [Streptomyces sioyaensis]
MTSPADINRCAHGQIKTSGQVLVAAGVVEPTRLMAHPWQNS